MAPQLILFGPPGVGKTYKIYNEILEQIGVAKDSDAVFKCTFHPEYRSSDFAAKLLPFTRDDGSVVYEVCAGPLLRALAYANETDKETVLIIDELNRGNASEIFSDFFTLLDRDKSGASCYSVQLNVLQSKAYRALCDKYPAKKLITGASAGKTVPATNDTSDVSAEESISADDTSVDGDIITVKFPKNFYIVASMNTSDENLFFIDSAFKRRWSYQYVDIDYWGDEKSELVKKQKAALLSYKDGGVQKTIGWDAFRKGLNDLIKTVFHHRRVDDRLVGPWFIQFIPIEQWFIDFEKFNNEIKSVSESLQKGVNSEDLSRKIDEKFKNIVSLDIPSNSPMSAMLEKIKEVLINNQSQPNEYYLTLPTVGPESGTSCWYINDSYVQNTKYKNNPQRFAHQKTLGGILKELGVDKVDKEFVSSKEVFERLHFILGEAIESVRMVLYNNDNSSKVTEKLFYYLWDGLFETDRGWLSDYLGLERGKITTFGDFVNNYDVFVAKIANSVDGGAGENQ